MTTAPFVVGHSTADPDHGYQVFWLTHEQYLIVERLYRELRVDRIWEGASEVQRLIIARALLKRGLGGM